MSRMLFASVAVLVLAVPAIVLAEQDKVSHHDRKFVERAASGGMFEVEIGQYAAQNGSSNTVKQFGQRMVTDHTNANQQLKQVAQQKGISIPSEMEHHERKEYDRLSKLSGAEFDRNYIQTMVTDHKKDIKEFEEEASKGSDPDIKAFASNTLPILRQHLQMAQDASASVAQGTPAQPSR